MTLAPAIHPLIRGVEGKARPVERVCCVPGCISLSQEGHHLWPKSYLRGQPTEWVHLPSGRVVSNKVGLCLRHHRWITGLVGGHLAQITLEPDETFIWLEKIEQHDGEGRSWHNMGLLAPQPWSETPVESNGSESKTAAYSHPDLAPGETCGTCGYTRPSGRKAGPTRNVKTYTLAVPDDAEIGADVLDEWIEQFAVILGFGPDVKQRLVRYHVMVAVLAWTMQHRQQFIEDIKEVAAA